MPKTTQVQTNWTAGELSPLSFGRTDLSKYKNGAKTLENWLPLRLGGITRRPGFRYVAEVKDSAKATRLIDFEFNAAQTYVLEFGGKDGTGRAIGTADSANNFFVVAGVDVTDTFLPSRRFTVSGSTGNDGEYAVITSEVDGTPDTTIYVESVTDATADGTITPHIGYMRVFRDEGQLESVPGTPTEIDSPYDEADLFSIKYEQTNDVMYLAHPDYPPFVMARGAGDDTQDATWTLTELNFLDGPYGDENTSATTMTASGAGPGSVTVTASGGTFVTSDVGRRIRIRDDGVSTGWGIITNYTSSTVVTVDVQVAVPTSAETTWSLGAWSATTGYPSTVGFSDDRLWWAATATEPNTIFSSRLGRFSSYRPSSRTGGDNTISNIEAIVAQLNSAQLDAIRWILTDARGIFISTDGGPWIMTKVANQLGPIDPDASSAPTFGYEVRQQNNDSVSELVQPQRAGKVVLQLQLGERRLLQEIFSFQDDKIRGTDISVLSDHILVGGVVESAFQDQPEQRLWLVRGDGQLVSMTLDAEQQVVAWARHILGGSAAGESQAVVESIATIREDTEDQLWAVVKRTINGQTKRYVEFMEETFDVNDEQDLAFFVDSGLSLGLPAASESKAITGAAQTNPVVVTSVAHGLSDGDVVRIRSVEGMTEINDRSFTIGNVQANTFTLLGEDGTSHSTYTADGYANKEVTSITGLSHLEGQSVAVAVDGGSHEPQVVVDGAITLNDAGSRVHVGLQISSRMTTMPITATTEGHDSRASIMQVSQIFLVVNRTLGGKVGREDGEYNEIIYREGVDPMGYPPPLYTGFIEVN